MGKISNEQLKRLVYNKILELEKIKTFNFLSDNNNNNYIRFMANPIPKNSSSLLSNVDLNNWYNPTGFKGSRNTTKNPVIVIVDAYTTPNIKTDLKTYCDTFNLPLMNGLPNVNDAKLGNFSIYYQQTNTNTSYTATYETTNNNMFVPNNSDWGLEINMDVQYAHTIAPYADIVLVLAKSSSVADLTSAVKFGNSIPNVVSLSMSWGANENTAYKTVDSMFNNANIIHTAASGDSGSAGGIIWPSANPNVVSVGGTTITKSNTTYSETAWSGSGGGVSNVYSKPTYQSKITLKKMRMNPDISMLASPSVSVCDSFYAPDIGWVYNIGGTSLASPLLAGLVALAIQYKYPTGTWTNITKSKFMNVIYNLSNNKNYNNVVRDIIKGNNGGYNTLTSFDLVTGVGSPKPTVSNNVNGLLYALTY